jgi:hypothetical protein
MIFEDANEKGQVALAIRVKKEINIISLCVKRHYQTRLRIIIN